MNYKCTTSFKATNGKSYSYGQMIFTSEHSSLREFEKGNFIYESDGTVNGINITESLISDIVETAVIAEGINIISDMFSGSSENSSSDSNSSSSDFDGFGSGDFGGGGASGDW